MMATSKATAAESLIDCVGRFRRRRVTVLGDLVADEFVYGDIARVSREAPVLVLEERRIDTAPGGGANAIANLCALGADVRAVGVVGRDRSGDRLVEQLAALGCRTRGILRRADHATPTKSRILAGGVHTRRQQIVRLDRGAARGEFSAEIRARLRKSLEQTLPRAEGLLVADYNYGSASPAIVRSSIGPVVRSGRPVTVDSRSRVASFRGITACTPNQEEVEVALGGGSIDGAQALDAAGRKLREVTGAAAVVVTRGAEGMSLFEKRRSALHIPAFGSDEVADVTGAGDTVIATFTLALIAGAGAPDAARLANYAAGIVVSKAGTATIGPDELIEAIREDLG